MTITITRFITVGQKPKHRNDNASIPSLRSLNKSWRAKVINKNGDTNTSLFNIGTDMDSLKGAEKVYFEDQKGERKFRISEDIDQEYVAKQEC